VGIVPVDDTDELMMTTVRGKIQRVAAKDISVIGRNTQGVRIMSLDEGDTLTAIVRVPPDEIDEAAIASAIIPPTNIAQPEAISGESRLEETRSDESDSDVDSDNED
jgi:DNA gyrase subunit A